MTDGIIIKGIGGFYYVETADGVFECKARGNFRNQSISPLAGDRVKISVNEFENSENRIESIEKRKNSFIRPPVANLDRLFIISSTEAPGINPFIIDKMIAIAEYKNVEPVIVFTKIDLNDSYLKYADIYKNAGFKVICCDNTSANGADKVKDLLPGKISAFTGNTGVGKSSLLNCIDSRLALQTGETSKKLGRGKHTTRQSELFKINGGYVADTPGFSSIDLEKAEIIMKDELFDCFREFEEYFGKCRFSTCTHRDEKGCEICEAVRRGDIAESRHNSYVQMYNAVKDLKEWEVKK